MPEATENEEKWLEEQAIEQARINARLAEIQKRHQVLAQMAADIKSEDEALKAEAAELLEKKLGTHQHDGGAIRLSPNRRWDDDTAREVLGEVSPDILTAIEVTRLDSKKAKELLPPALYKRCMKDADQPRVTFL